MASIGKDPGGRKRILFVAPSGKRKTIRLGKLSMRAAEGVKFRIGREDCRPCRIGRYGVLAGKFGTGDGWQVGGGRAD